MRRIIFSVIAGFIITLGAVTLLALSTALTWQLLSWAFGIGVGIGGGCGGG